MVDGPVPAPAAEMFDVFQVTQLTRGTPLEREVAADLVRIPAGSTSQVHRHNEAETVLYILEGSGVVRIGEADHPARRGDRLCIGKGVFHGVRTAGEAMTFLSVQSPPILDRDRGALDLEPLDS
jgi:quercetin dioxygenase-like cupin family protein